MRRDKIEPAFLTGKGAVSLVGHPHCRPRLGVYPHFIGLLGASRSRDSRHRCCYQETGVRNRRFLKANRLGSLFACSSKNGQAQTAPIPVRTRERRLPEERNGLRRGMVYGSSCRRGVLRRQGEQFGAQSSPRLGRHTLCQFADRLSVHGAGRRRQGLRRLADHEG